MTGMYTQTIDAKGRLYIPAKIRKELGETIYISLSTQNCISMYSQDRWAKLVDNFASVPKGLQLKMRRLFASTYCCEFDKRGYLSIPPVLRTSVGITKEVVIVGAGDSCEIWDSGVWNEIMPEPDITSITEVFEILNF